MIKAYSYIRFSTPEQLKGDSLRRQIELSERYAKEHGFVLDDSLSLKDMGISAYSGKHRDKGALGIFLKLVEMNKIEKGSVLLVESFDRLSREEVFDALNQFMEIVKKGVRIVTLMDQKEYSRETIKANWSELIYSLSIMARAHEESAIKARRLSAKWENKRSQTSIKLTAKAPAWLKLSEDRTYFEPIADRVKMIRLVFHFKLSGMGKSAIVKKLNSMHGWKPGGGWRESYIQKILKNPAVIGEFQPHKMSEGQRKKAGDKIIDYFPSIVDQNIFYRVQKQFSQNKLKGGQTGKVNNLFSHIVKCGYCGGSMAFIDKGSSSKGGKIMVCDRARRSLNCCRTAIKYGEVENLILTFCKGLSPNDILTQDNDTVIGLLKNELDGITGELNSINIEIENLTDAIATTPDKSVRDTLTKGTVKRHKKLVALNQKKDCLKQQIDAESKSFENTDLTLNSLRELFDFLKTAHGNKLTDIRLKLRNELRRLINSIEIFPEGIVRLSSKSAQKALKEMAELVPAGTKDYDWLKQNLSRRVEHPKEFRSFRINFISGSWRSIFPERQHRLAVDFDRDEEVLRTWQTRPNGKTICEEYRIDGLHMRVEELLIK